MKAPSTNYLIAAGLLAVASIASPAALHAQAAPGPIHPATQSDSSAESPVSRPAPAKVYPPQKKENLAGSFRINPDESDDAHQKIEQARDRNSGNNPNAGNGGNNPNSGSGGGNGPYGRGGAGSPYPGGGSPYPGNGGGNSGGNGPYGRHGSNPNATTYEDRQQLQDLVEPATSLTLTQKENEVDVTDDQGRKRVNFTDSRKPQKSQNENYREYSAHWEGARLVSEEKGLHGGRITRTYELTPDGKQLIESVRLDNTHTGLVTVRYVFDATTSSAPPTAPAAK